VKELVPILEAEGDERGAVQAIDLLVEVDWMACRYAAVEEALERVAARARQIDDRRLEMGALHRLAMAVCYGPTPVEEAIRRCRHIEARASGDRRVEASVLIAQAELQAMLGRFDGTREQIVEAREILQDLGLRILSLAPLMSLGNLELLAGDPDAAERNLLQAYEGLQRLGERGFLSTIAALLANAIYEQGRYDEAERYARISEEAGGSDDVASVVISRSILGKVLARQDRLSEGEALIRGAVKLAESTDDLVMRGDTHVDLAESLSLSGSAEEAAAALERATTLFERKGNVVSAGRARERLAALATTSGPA
jgi:ATP/maltotriose-dependent transcriptional regulator MalT